MSVILSEQEQALYNLRVMGFPEVKAMHPKSGPVERGVAKVGDFVIQPGELLAGSELRCIPIAARPKIKAVTKTGVETSYEIGSEGWRAVERNPEKKLGNEGLVYLAGAYYTIEFMGAAKNAFIAFDAARKQGKGLRLTCGEVVKSNRISFVPLVGEVCDLPEPKPDASKVLEIFSNPAVSRDNSAR